MPGFTFPMLEWSTSTAPAVGVAASVTRTAPATGNSHVLTGVFATMFGTATSTLVTFSVTTTADNTLYRDGSVIGVLGNGDFVDRIHVPTLFIKGDDGQGLTAAFNTAGGAAVRQVITLKGVTVPS